MVSAAAVDGVELREIAEVVCVFGMGAPTDVRVVPEGLMNRNWRVTTAAGVYALKQVQDVDAAQVRRLHAATTALAARGLPVATPVATLGGETVVEQGGSCWTLTPWVPGAHHHGLQLRLAQCREVGRLLAVLHAGLGEVMPPPPANVVVPVPEVGTTLTAVDRYLEIAAGRQPPDKFDRLVRTRLLERRGMLAELAHLHPGDDVPAGRVGWVHGDFHTLNLTWRAGRVAGVFDWDRIKVWPVAAEVVRAATLMFSHGDERGLDLPRMAAFVAGYRDHTWLADAELAGAAHRRWWDQLCGLWVLKCHYGLGDARCDHLFVSDCAVLAWWNGHRDQVTAAVTGL